MDARLEFLRTAGQEAWGVVLRGLTDRRFGREKLSRAIGFARAAMLFRGVRHGERLCALGKVRVENRGRLVIGDRVTFVGGMIPTELVTHHGGLLQIGSNTSFNYGSHLEAFGEVKIGSNCLFASLVQICDRSEGKTAPIVVGDDVWVAHGAILSPGVTIGDRSVVAAGSVITKDVPPDMLAIGNPARAMKLSTIA